MTSVPPRIQYVANGTQTAFEFPFAIFNASNIKVYWNSEEQDSTTYTVTCDSEGGTVTFNEAPEENTLVTIMRYLTIERTSDFQEGGALRANVLNDELDYQIIHQLYNTQK